MAITTKAAAPKARKLKYTKHAEEDGIGKEGQGVVFPPPPPVQSQYSADYLLVHGYATEETADDDDEKPSHQSAALGSPKKV